MQDIYNRELIMERREQLIEKSNMSEYNKKIIIDFENVLFGEGLKLGSIQNLLFNMKFIGENVDKKLDAIDEQDIMSLLKKIETKKWADSTKYNVKITLKKFCGFIEQEELSKKIKIKNSKNRKLPDELLTKEEIEKMISVASHPRDKALIAALYETGCRISELLLMQVKHITFDDHGAVLILADGKTGMRRVRVVYASSFLRQWMDSHPINDRDAPLWITLDKNRTNLKYNSVRKMIWRAAEKAEINKRVHPHLFRHSRATHLTEHMTEQQMKQYLGWVADSKMAAIYVHISGRDMDDAVLKMYGLQKEEDLIDPMKPGQCPRCHELNPPNARYCFKCGLMLSKEQITVENEAMKEIMEKLQTNPELLMEALRLGAAQLVSNE